METEEEFIILVDGAKVSKNLIIRISEKHNVPIEVIISACNGCVVNPIKDRMSELAELCYTYPMMEIKSRPEYHEAPGRS